MASSKTALQGGGWLIDDAAPGDVLSPEDLHDEHRAMQSSVAEFMRREVLPKAVQLDGHDYGLLRELLRKAGGLGILGVEVPEAYGGLGLDIVSSALAFEAVGGGGSGSFATTVGAHSGIGTWPILFFGNDEQRKKYLPGIVSGESVAAYCLTESGSGSDALAAKCKATLSDDGSHWVVNGEKVFITNAAIADVFTVFVKIDGEKDKMACLIVDRDTPGFSIAKEEHKMGIRGSSTCRIIFEDARVPKENLLGEIGKGHKIVLGTLNLGRFKLGAAAAGGLKMSVNASVEYAAERKQFGVPILSFDAVRAKVADMTVAAWVGESMVYRAAGSLAKNLEGAAPGDAANKAIEEYTIECSLVKVALSEMLCVSVDEALQIHGGYGFIEEYPVARAYRDARINRIFEGTNEINRMLAVGDLMKRAMKGKLDVLGAVAALAAAPAREGAHPLATALDGAKKATLFTLGQAVQKHMMGLEKEQQTLIALADMLIGVYAMESAFLRWQKLAQTGVAAPVEEAIVRAFFRQTLVRLHDSADLVLSSLAEGADRVKLTTTAANYLLAAPSEDLVALRRIIAAAAAVKGGYPF